MKKFSKEYLEYIHSEEWKKKRQHIAWTQKNTCQICGNKVYKNFQVHHLNYENLGKEQDKDLILLCEHCHSNIHKRDLSVNQKYRKYHKKTKKRGKNL